ncbi:hypothetical protein XENOCAPTIV_021636, partial [Xenoophorus captivus]
HSGASCDGQQPSSSASEQPLDLPPPGLQSTDDKQTVRHVLLCLLLSVSLLAVRKKQKFMKRDQTRSCLWWLFNKDPGRLYLELQFFCAVANYGQVPSHDDTVNMCVCIIVGKSCNFKLCISQGFLSFGIFGLDRHLIIVPFKKRFLSLWHGRDVEDLSPSAVPEEVRLTCTQFVRYHKDQCVQDIVHTRRFRGVTHEESGIGRCLSHYPQYLNTNTYIREQRSNESQNLHQNYNPDESCNRTLLPCYLEAQDEQQGYVSIPDGHNEEVSQHELGTSPPQSCPESVFRGSDLVDWLMERGLCVGRTEAKLYCVCLQQGGVLTGQQSFRDEPTSFYHFTQEERCSRNM